MKSRPKRNDNIVVYNFNTGKGKKVQNQNFKMHQIHPLTEAQGETFDAYYEGYNLLLHGLAGTGKTFISLYLALREVLDGDTGRKNITIVRSVVPTRDMGFLPGSASEKSRIYEQPYSAICNELFSRGDAYEVLKRRGIIDFMTTSYIRGTTMNDSIIIVDECQNMTFHELDSTLTRIGHNSKILFCGDFRQTDLNKPYDRSGIKDFMSILEIMSSFDYVEFGEDDIVRSGLVKEYIIAKERSGFSDTLLPA